MALIHENFYQSDDFSNINFGNYVKTLSRELFSIYNIKNHIILKTDIDNISLGLDIAIPCGLLVNELLSNSLKHAFPGDRNGEISIKLKTANEENIELIVSDDGIGISENINFYGTNSLGLYLVKTLVEHQLGGNIIVNRTTGTHYHIMLKKRFIKKGHNNNVKSKYRDR